MRLDLFLKWSRVIPRRTLAKATCDAGRVKVNNVDASAGHDVKVGDIVTVEFARRLFKFRIDSIPAHAPSKVSGREMIEIVEDRRID